MPNCPEVGTELRNIGLPKSQLSVPTVIPSYGQKSRELRFKASLNAFDLLVM